MIRIIVAVVFLASLLYQDVVAEISCPKGIRRFSYLANSNKYYDCTTATAVLTHCPKNMTYVADKEACFANDLPSTNHKGQIERHLTTGQAFVGDLYDADYNDIHVGSSLWKIETVEAKKIRTRTPTLTVKLFRSKMKNDRLERAELSAAMKADIAGGLIRLKGSSLYYQDEIKSSKEAVVVLTYDETTVTDTLPSHIPKDYDCPEHNKPTHVVSGLTLGVSINFVFKRTVMKNESVDEVAADVEEAIKMLKTESRISEKTKRVLANVAVDVFSDIVFQNTPSTATEAMEVYRALPSKIAKTSNLTIPYSLHLTPIDELCSSSKTKFVPVSNEILEEIQIMFAEIASNELAIRTLQGRDVVKSYKPLSSIAALLKRKLRSFELKIKRKVQINLPLVRSGESGEESLVQLLNEYHASPFDNDHLKKFLNNRRKEADRLEFILDPEEFHSSGIKLVSYDETMDMSVVFTKAYVTMLRFNVLPSTSLVHKFLDGEEVHEERSWYRHPYTISALGRSLKQFIGFSSINVPLVDHGYLFGIGDYKNDSFAVVLQKEGLLYDIETPDTPVLPLITSVTHVSVTFVVSRPLDSWITGVNITYWVFGRHETSKSKKQRFSSGDTTTLTLYQLTPGSRYSFKVQYTTVMGTSQSSEIGVVTLRGCGPPTNVRAANVEADSITLSWDIHQACGKHVVVKGFNVTIIGNDKSRRSFIVEGKAKVHVAGLKETTTYEIMVSSIYNKSGDFTPTSSLPSRVVRVTTLPATLEHLSLIYRTKHSARVSWSGCRKVSEGGKLLGYRISYSMTNNVGNVTYNGTKVSVMTKNTSYVMTDLMQGTTYAVTVQAVTSSGSSRFTPKLFLMTTYEKSQLEKLRDEVEKKIQQGEDNLQASITGVNSSLLHSIQSTKGDLEKKSSATKANLTRAINEVTSDLQKEDIKLSSSIKRLSDTVKGQEEILQYVKKYGLIFVGRGYGYPRDDSSCASVSSLEECLGYWSKHRPGAEWNGLFFDTRDNQCCVTKNERGENPYPTYYHFKFV